MVKRNSMLTNKLKQEGHDGPKALTWVQKYSQFLIENGKVHNGGCKVITIVVLLGEIKKTEYKLTGTLFSAVHFFKSKFV
jgi:hypothetical protein